MGSDPCTTNIVASVADRDDAVDGAGVLDVAGLGGKADKLLFS